MPIVLLGAGLLAVMGCLTLVGLARVHDYSTGAVLQSIADWFRTQTRVTLAGITVSLAFIGDGLIALDNNIRNAIGQGIEALASPLVGVISRAANILEAIGGTAADVAHSTEQALIRMLRYSIPALIAAKIASELKGLHVTSTVTHYITKTLPQKVERLATITKVYPVKIERVAGLPALVEATVDHALDGIAIPRAIPRVKDVTHGTSAIWQEIRRLGKYATVAGIIGLVGASVFSHFKLGWLRCSNVNRVGKFLCGMERGLLDALLAGLAVWLGTLNLRTFAKDIEGVLGTAERDIRRFWQADVVGPGKDRPLGSTGL